MITVKDLTASLGRKAIVKKASFSIADGSTAVFIGSNGAGKTTTLRAMTGLIPASGFSSLAGNNRHAEVGVSLGPDYLPLDISIANFLKLTACKSLPRPDRATELLGELSLEGFENTKIQKLSTGMRQKVALIGAFRCSPPSVILDEPYNGLDPDSIEWLEAELQQIRARGGSTLLSSHLLREAAAVADVAFKIENATVSQVAWPAKEQAGAWGKIWVDSTNPVKLQKVLIKQGFSAEMLETRIETNAPASEVLAAANNSDFDLTNMGPADQSTPLGQR